MLTRKGRLRCDACGKKQPKRDAEFLLVAGWALGPSARLDKIELLDVLLADHFCSSRRLAHWAISEAISDVEMADFTD